MKTLWLSGCRRPRMSPSFAKRFWTVYNQIKDATEVAVKSFKQALLLGNELRKDLVRFPVVTMKALMARANQFIEQEED